MIIIGDQYPCHFIYSKRPEDRLENPQKSWYHLGINYTLLYYPSNTDVYIIYVYIIKQVP